VNYVGSAVNCSINSFTTATATNKISTAKGGLWNDVNTWVGGVVPVDYDSVTIADGATVVVNQTVNLKGLRIGQGSPTNAAVLHWGATGYALTVTGNIRYNQAQNNATVTQQTNKTTAVTCNGRTGQITTSNGALTKGVAVKFTVNNSYITSAKDVIIVNVASGATVPYSVSVNNISSSGSFDITINNADGTGSGANASDTLVLNFAVIKVN
jgi:hypothetical protein